MSASAMPSHENPSLWRDMFTNPHSKAFTRWVAIINF